MYRLLLVSALLAALYLLLRRALQGFKNKEVDGRGKSVAHDQMVEDPMCHTFVPCRTAVVQKVGGQTYSFCSQQCADDFKKRQTG